MADSKEGLGFPPPHPGEYLREDIRPALGMTVKALAEHLGIGRAALSDLLHERKSVTLDMAQRLGKAFGNGARFWLALQLKHDLWHAERKNTVDVKPLDWDDRAA